MGEGQHPVGGTENKLPPVWCKAVVGFAPTDASLPSLKDTNVKYGVRPSKFIGLHVHSCAGIFKQSMGARNRVGIGLLYRPDRPHRPAELVPWNRFLGSIKV